MGAQAGAPHRRTHGKGSAAIATRHRPCRGADDGKGPPPNTVVPSHLAFMASTSPASPASRKAFFSLSVGIDAAL